MHFCDKVKIEFMTEEVLLTFHSLTDEEIRIVLQKNEAEKLKEMLKEMLGGTNG